jgi:hypothetical protein
MGLDALPEQHSHPHPNAEDLAAVGRENCTVTPTGAAFVKPALRSGILPDILAALMTARWGLGLGL